MPLAAGTAFGGYDILGPLGAGAMGEVYRAREAALNREVAIKVLPAFDARNPDRLRRFQQEAQATGSLNHPNILAVYCFGSYSGAPYLVSELLLGATLRETMNPRACVIDLAAGNVTTQPGSEVCYHRAGLRTESTSPHRPSISSASISSISNAAMDRPPQRHHRLPRMVRRQPLPLLPVVCGDSGVFRVSVADGRVERLFSLMNVGYTGTLGSWMGLDPTDAPLMLRDRGTNDIYALTPAEQ